MAPILLRQAPIESPDAPPPADGQAPGGRGRRSAWLVRAAVLAAAVAVAAPLALLALSALLIVLGVLVLVGVAALLTLAVRGALDRPTRRFVWRLWRTRRPAAPADDGRRNVRVIHPE